MRTTKSTKSTKSTKTAISGNKYGLFYNDGGIIRGPLYGIIASKACAIESMHDVKRQIKRTPILAKVSWTADIKG